MVVHVEGLDRLWPFKSELRVPLAHIAAVERATDEAQRDERVSWDVRDPGRAIAIRSHLESDIRLVIEVENPVQSRNITGPTKS